jgi:hypothetical protein
MEVRDEKTISCNKSLRSKALQMTFTLRLMTGELRLAPETGRHKVADLAEMPTYAYGAKDF